MDDAIALTAHAATLVSSFKDAQAAAKKSKVSKSFEEGNATNLEGAQGGESPVKSAAQARVDNRVNRSSLIQDQLRTRRNNL